MAIDILLHEAQGLPEDALMEVVRFVKFIKSESINRASNVAPKEQAAKKIRPCLKNKCCTTGYDYVNCLYGNETI